MPREYVEIEDVRCIRETDDAILVVVEEREVWIPKSQISSDSEVCEKGNEGTLVVAEWIAVDRELV